MFESEIGYKGREYKNIPHSSLLEEREFGGRYLWLWDLLTGRLGETGRKKPGSGDGDKIGTDIGSNPELQREHHFSSSHVNPELFADRKEDFFNEIRGNIEGGDRDGN